MFDLSLRSLGYATGVTLVSFGLAKVSVKALNAIKEDVLDVGKKKDLFLTALGDQFNQYLEREVLLLKFLLLKMISK